MGICTSHESTQVRVLSSNFGVSNSMDNGVASSASGIISAAAKSNGYELRRIVPAAMVQGCESFGFRRHSATPHKQKSDMNLLDVPKECIDIDEQINFNSRFEREKLMLVLCSNANTKKPSRLIIYDVDYLSKNYMKEVSRLDLPYVGDDLVYCAWQNVKSPMAVVRSIDDESTVAPQSSLVLPCVNTSRVYIVSVDEYRCMRVTMCIGSEELSRWNLSCPLSVCHVPGRVNCTMICALADREGRAKGDFLRLDRRFFASIDKRRISTSVQDEKRDVGGDATSDDASEARRRYVAMGGNVALLYKQGYLFSTEWAEPEQLLEGISMKKWLYNEMDAFGGALNVWDVCAQRLMQRIPLESREGRFPTCVRCLHRAEMTHGYVCTALGSCIFHLHKNSRTGLFAIDRVAKFAPAVVDDWINDLVPAFPVDMVISMDDLYLYVSCWLQGFIAQFEISDPFRLSLMNRFFIGGIIHKSIGVRLNTIASKNFTPQKRIVAGVNYEGGPARLQLSLDGRRLYVTNSFLKAWDKQFFPNLLRNGSSLAIIQIDAKKAMSLDEKAGLHFGTLNLGQLLDKAQTLSASSSQNPIKGYQQAQQEKDKFKAAIQKANSILRKTPSDSSVNNIRRNEANDTTKDITSECEVFLAREIRFFNGDSTTLDGT